MHPRDTTRLASGEFDVLVIGGGIHGLATAYEAASRGLRTSLIDAADFGSGITFNHQKTVHGGLRSLQSLNVRRAREGVRERRAMARIAPWLLRPLPFVMGTYRSLVKGRTALRIGFRLERLLARDRNEGVERELHLPAPKLLSRPLTMKLFPGIREQDLTGGAQWYDYQMIENDRLTFAFAAAADRAGAVLLNYVEAVEALRHDGRVAGVTARDAETGETFPVRASLTINVTGSRAGDVRRMLGVDRAFPLLAAMNLVAARPAREIGLAAPAATGRMLTLVPWQHHVIVGTGQSNTLADHRQPGVTANEISAFVAEANAAFPALGLTPESVTLVHRGLVPATVSNGRPELLGEPAIEDHSREGAAGAMTVIGVKYTTARAVAERAVNTAARLLRKPIRRSTTSTTVLPGAGIADHEALAIETARRARVELTPATTTRLATIYAEQCAEIVRLAAQETDLARPLVEGSAPIAAEIVSVIRQEMAIHLSDILIRRTGLGAAGHPGAEIVAAAAGIAARELGWPEERTRQEIGAVDRFYARP